MIVLTLAVVRCGCCLECLYFPLSVYCDYRFPSNSSGAPVYEIPKETYSGEQLLDILFDPDESRICRERPMRIIKSCTFVVDLDALKHPDDVKKGEFGKWHYSGSHVVCYKAYKSPTGVLEFEKASKTESESLNTFELRRVHCKHPSNSQFSTPDGFCDRYVCSYDGVVGTW